MSRLTDFSSGVADLVLAASGEYAAAASPARRSWHRFFYLGLAAIVWHILVRLFVVPSLGEKGGDIVRLIDVLEYILLFAALVHVASSHYRHVFRPGASLRLATISFFLFVVVVLLTRIFYSIYVLDPALFLATDPAATPSPDFGVNGAQDLRASIEFAIFSACTLASCEFSTISSASQLISSIQLAARLLGIGFIAVVVATVVQKRVSVDRSEEATSNDEEAVVDLTQDDRQQLNQSPDS